MILTHYSAGPLVFDANRRYQTPQRRGTKPDGLWLSDDASLGWREWCQREEWNEHNLQYIAHFQVDLTRVLWLAMPDMIRNFTDRFSSSPQSSMIIDWPAVATIYSGILITPYQWECRLDRKSFWYHGWDCASACVWDLSVVKQVLA